LKHVVKKVVREEARKP